MNINEMTIGQIANLAAALAGQSGGGDAKTFTPHIGKKCIIRTYASGVHFGTLTAQSGREVELTYARRLWRWKTAEGISLSDLAMHGIDHGGSKICEVVPAMTILDALEIIPASDAAISSIEGAETYTR